MKLTGKKKNRIIFFLLFISLVISLNFINIEVKGNLADEHRNDKKYNNRVNSLINSKYWNLTGTPILIDDWKSNYNWERISSENEWCSGSGTADDPYIIENIIIDGKSSGSCITIRNSNAYFIIKNCTLYNSGWTIFKWDAAVKLINTRNGKLLNNNCSFNKGCGILQILCFNNNVSNNLVNYNSHYGIYYWLSENNFIQENKINNNEINGIYFWFSEKNNISENSINFNRIGINFVISNNNLIAGNYLIGNNVSIYQFLSQGNIIQNNKYEYELPPPEIDNGEDNGEDDGEDNEEVNGYDEDEDDDEGKIKDSQEAPNISLIILGTMIGMLSGGIIGYIIHKKKIQKTSIIPISKFMKEKSKIDSFTIREDTTKPKPEFELIPKKAIVKFKDLIQFNEEQKSLKNNSSENEKK